MPQTEDSLPDFVEPAQRAALREIFLNEVTTVSCLYWRNSAPWNVEWRKCPDTFLLFPVRGAFRVRLRERTFAVRPGKFLILPEETPHALEIARGEKHLWQISLHCHIHDRWGRSAGSRLKSETGVLDHPAETHRALSELVCLMGYDPSTAQVMGTGLVRELLASQSRRGGFITAEETGGDPRVRVAIERMEEGFGSPELSIEELAASVGITAVQFRKLFRRDTGESPKRFLQALRLRRSVQLLRHTPRSVKEIAAQCGFASDHYFHLAFRQKFGSTPSQYRAGSPF